jgi:hypothetical protein
MASSLGTIGKKSGAGHIRRIEDVSHRTLLYAFDMSRSLSSDSVSIRMATITRG